MIPCQTPSTFKISLSCQKDNSLSNWMSRNWSVFPERGIFWWQRYVSDGELDRRNDSPASSFNQLYSTIWRQSCSQSSLRADDMQVKTAEALTFLQLLHVSLDFDIGHKYVGYFRFLHWLCLFVFLSICLSFYLSLFLSVYLSLSLWYCLSFGLSHSFNLSSNLFLLLVHFFC